MTAKRSIFEEVGPGERQPAVEGGLIDRGRAGSRRAVRIWLGILFVLVAAMIAVGGLTRLTDSGLSITEWRPVTGAIPPLSAEDWQAEFDKYRQIPEFIEQNSWMTVEDFKSIYWWEWGHRQLGRAIGLVWALGLLFLFATRRVPPGWGGRLFLVGVLGGLQGAVGWWMVSSGLGNGMLDVASYRLATHLGLAFVILGFIAWYYLTLGRPAAELLQARRSADRAARAWATALVHLTFLQVLLGALVAGIDAGRTFTDWPLMAGQILPPDPFDLSPVWRNFFENESLVQFNHRIVGYLVVLAAVLAFARMRRAPMESVRQTFAHAALMAVIQMVLGIATVLMAAPAHVAIVHQIGAVVLWVLVLRARHMAIYPRGTAIQGGTART